MQEIVGYFSNLRRDRCLSSPSMHPQCHGTPIGATVLVAAFKVKAHSSNIWNTTNKSPIYLDGDHSPLAFL